MTDQSPKKGEDEGFAAFDGPLELQSVDRRPGQTAPQPEPPPKSGNSTILVVLAGALVVAAAGGTWVLLRHAKPAEPPPVAVDPATLGPKTFDPSSSDTRLSFVDFRKGLVVVRDPSDIEARGQCALMLESAADPAPPDVYYWAEAFDLEPGPIVGAPVHADAFTARAWICDQAALLAEDVAWMSDGIVDQTRLAALEDGESIDDPGEESAKPRKKKKRRKIVIEGVGSSGGASRPSSMPVSGGFGGGGVPSGALPAMMNRKALIEQVRERGGH